MRPLIGLTAVLAGAAVAAGQQPFPAAGPVFPPAPFSVRQPGGVAPRPTLSPYLNLLNGINPALNYFYGVRPFTQPPSSFAPTAQPGFAPTATGKFFRPVPPPVEPSAYPEPDDRQRFTLPSAGGPVVYGNVFGSSRAGVQGSRPGNFAPTRPAKPAPAK